MKYGKCGEIASAIFLLLFLFTIAFKSSVAKAGSVQMGAHGGGDAYHGRLPAPDSDGALRDNTGRLVFAAISYAKIPYLQLHVGYIERAEEKYNFAGVDILVVDAYGNPMENTRGFLNAAPYAQGGFGLSFFDRLTENIGTRQEAHLFLKTGFVKKVFRFDLFSYITLDHWSNGRHILGSKRVPGPNLAEEFIGWGMGFSF